MDTDCLMMDSAAAEQSREMSMGVVSPTMTSQAEHHDVSRREDLETDRSDRTNVAEDENETEQDTEMVPELTSNDILTGQTPALQSPPSSDPPPLHIPSIENFATESSDPSSIMSFDPWVGHSPAPVLPPPPAPEFHDSAEFKTHREEALSIIQGVRKLSDDGALIALRDAQKTLRRMLELVIKTREEEGSQVEGTLDHPD